MDHVHQLSSVNNLCSLKTFIRIAFKNSHFSIGNLKVTIFLLTPALKPWNRWCTISTVQIRLKIAQECKGWSFILHQRAKQHAGLACRQISFSSRRCFINSPSTDTSVAANINNSQKENRKNTEGRSITFFRLLLLNLALVSQGLSIHCKCNTGQKNWFSFFFIQNHIPLIFTAISNRLKI